MGKKKGKIGIVGKEIWEMRGGKEEVGENSEKVVGPYTFDSIH